MNTVTHQLDTTELEQRVKQMYQEVCDASLWPACIGGAMQGDSYRAAIEAAGFEIGTWRENTAYRFVSERADNATQKYGVTSISLLARRR
jgi:arsenite methyltransferase